LIIPTSFEDQLYIVWLPFFIFPLAKE